MRSSRVRRGWTAGAVCLVIAVPTFASTEGSAVATQCSGAAAAATVYDESFDAGPVDAAVWNVDANEGSVTVVAGAARVASPTVLSFPFVTSAVPLLPATDGFSVRWSADYEQSTLHGTCTLVASRSVPTDGDSNNTSIGAFSACQDSLRGFNVAVALSASQFPIAHAVPGGELDPVDLEYCWLADRVELWVDGTRVLDAARDPAFPRPDSLWFGNYARGGIPTPWSNFTLDRVTVTAFDLDGDIFADGFEPLPNP